jgi:hypothetical protein
MPRPVADTKCPWPTPDFINGDYDIRWLEKFVGLS